MCLAYFVMNYFAHPYALEDSMSRTARMLIEDQPTVYHLMSHSALPGTPITDEDKERLLNIIRHFSAIYFIEIIGYCIMGNHFHILARMLTQEQATDSEVARRLKLAHGEKLAITPEIVRQRKRKLTSLSEFMRDVKQTFSRYYNKKNNRRGYFWDDRFRSVMIEDGRALIHCLAYIDLNPVRANSAKRPEDYRWCSLARHVQTGNEDGWLCTEFGLEEWDIPGSDKLTLYREYLFETGALDTEAGKPVDPRVLAAERKRGYEITPLMRLIYTCRYYAQGAILGSREYVLKQAKRFGITTKNALNPPKIEGMPAIFAIKKLSEKLY